MQLSYIDVSVTYKYTNTETLFRGSMYPYIK